ncbi:hypothetical protein DM02DRAFT_650316 [Periconia macrospinosa]|uniref:Uncharacterized protein n=1 Tax=Periconia macrospinosa TaxID=97972 RepID=A0A2V1E7H6_9PLEO|nr:hypothetical protein DM02DRAFT_650316 [Periconia macrospinosa]
MPVLPDSSSSSSSNDHNNNDNNNKTSDGGSVSAAAAMAHKGNPGPVITENMPEPASKEELRKRAAELNK